MPSKLQFYSEFAERTARQITGSYRSWTAFLATAARLYKYPYNKQLMIYAQRPSATACAEYDFWKDRIGRYVQRVTLPAILHCGKCARSMRRRSARVSTGGNGLPGKDTLRKVL